MRISSAISTLLLCFPVAAAAAIDARMLRHPDVSETQITFVYAGDIWLVDKAGGIAQRLSSPAGEESFPKFSPDGSEIAFSGNYDGNQDVYVVAAEGGLPERITHHPAGDRLVDWYPDGQSLLYLRELDEIESQPIVGSDGAQTPSFSADGEWIGFHDGGALVLIF